MKTDQKLSPKKYIKTKARKLSIYQCLVNPDWETTGMANVIVERKHNNGNITAGIYLVDLMCLGIKDTFYFFNETKDNVMEKLSTHEELFTVIDYNLAHNIIYAGHDFAAQFDIQPNKEFSTTRFILEEDDESIPMIDVHTGDENGNPKLIVTPEYNYKPVLEKLKKHAGEGNYVFLISDFDLENELDDEDDEDDLEFDDGNDLKIEDIENDFIDFDNIRDASDEELEEAFDDETRSIADSLVLHSAIMMRLLNEREPGWLKDEDEIVSSEDFKIYESKIELHEASFNENENLISLVFKDFKAIPSGAGSDIGEKSPYFKLFQKYAHKELAAFMALNIMPLLTMATNLVNLQSTIYTYPPLVQLAITAFSLALQQKSKGNFAFITKASVVEEAYPGKKHLHAMHHKIFWVVKALDAMNKDNKESIQHYHALITITGIGGSLKQAYAIRLSEWLENN